MQDVRRRRALLFVGWAAVIFAFSSLPRSTVARWNPGVASGWGHFLEYGLLGWLWLRWRRAAGPRGWTGTAGGILLAAAIAAADEAYQSLIPGRVPELRDGLVDLGGFAAGILAGTLVNRARPRAGGERNEGAT
jgi:VanZ family protein